MTKQQRIINDQAKKVPAQHQGMPARKVRPEPSLVDKQISRRDASTETSLYLPHERDQSEAMTSAERPAVIKQAFGDEAKGLQDTSKEPEMLEAYEKQKR